jgi:transposase
MTRERSAPQRYIGLDAHKRYLVAHGVDDNLNDVLGPRRVSLVHLERWAAQELGPTDALVIEMSTNTFDLHDHLLPHVHSVTVVHPPHVKLVTQARVKTDKQAARNLARLHAAGLFENPVWVPPQAVRDLRAIVAQRRKMVRLATQAKNRLRAVLHRHRLAPPDGSPFAPHQQAWWQALPVSASEAVRVRSDWQTLTFAQEQTGNDNLKVSHQRRKMILKN